MKILFIASTKTREKDLAEAFTAGALKIGDRAEWTCARVESIPRFGEFDAVAMVGVKSRKFWVAAIAAGAVPIMFDKGYVRERREDARVWAYWRASVGTHHPTTFLPSQSSPSDRFDALGLEVRDWNTARGHILLAGSSAKFHDFAGLIDPTKWARRVVKDIRRYTKRQIVYRPKPSWREAVPIPRTRFSGSKDNLATLLGQTGAIVTYASNISFEGVLHGVPSIVLGNGVARAIMSDDISTVAKPELPSDAARRQWLQNLAYWQWTEDELRSGEAWDFLRRRVLAWRNQ
jgi:hypothetical protein